MASPDAAAVAAVPYIPASPDRTYPNHAAPSPTKRNVEKRKWAAADLADRIQTTTQAARRIARLGDMIRTHEYLIKKEEIMIKKLQKERNILKERWNIA